MNTCNLTPRKMLPIFFLSIGMLTSTNFAVGQHDIVIAGPDGKKTLAQFVPDSQEEEKPILLTVQDSSKPVQYALQVQNSAIAQLNDDQKEDEIDLELVSNYWIGVRCEKAGTTEYSPGEAPEMELSVEGGIKVIAVTENSASEEAGLEEGDVLLRFSDQKLNSLNDLYAVIGKTKDTKAEVILIRKGKLITSEITPQERPEEKSESASPDARVNLWTLEEAYVNELKGKQVPEGLRIQVDLERGEKVKFKVIRGDDWWKADSSSIESLPKSVQPLAVKIVSECKPMVEEKLTGIWSGAVINELSSVKYLPQTQMQLATREYLRSSIESSIGDLEQKILELTKSVKELESKMDK